MTIKLNHFFAKHFDVPIYNSTNLGSGFLPALECFVGHLNGVFSVAGIHIWHRANKFPIGRVQNCKDQTNFESVHTCTSTGLIYRTDTVIGGGGKGWVFRYSKCKSPPSAFFPVPWTCNYRDLT